MNSTAQPQRAKPSGAIEQRPHSTRLGPFVLGERRQRRRARRMLLCQTAAALALVLAGCATYVPRPLPPQARLQEHLDALQIDRERIALPRLAAQPINLDAPLTMDAVATLAVLHNPQLQQARDRLGVARAQAFAAGLLPDPQFSASYDNPGHSAHATSSAYNDTLSFDLGSLITRPAAQAAARAHVRSVNLQLLWQEWQSASQAQLLFVQLVGLRDRDALLQTERNLVLERLHRARDAASAGNLPRTDADADLVELQRLDESLARDARQRVTLQANLHTLLGLDPQVRLRLAALPVITSQDAQSARVALTKIADIRPDLMALRGGYTSQEQRLREAVLAQFPSFSVGLTRARDTSNVNTLGFGVSFTLPIFNGSRGAIAVQRATRQELYDVYQLRLNQTRADVEQALANLALLEQQHQSLQLALPALQSASAAADTALSQGAITLPQAQAQRMALLDQRMALQANAQQMAEQAVALDLLTGAGIYRQTASSAQPPASSRSAHRSLKP